MKPPALDRRSRDDVAAQALLLAGRDAPPGWVGYVPEWTAEAEQGDPGYRAVELFARLMELLIERLNRMPEKNFLAFLDLAGVERFPGAPARVPVTFVVGPKARAGGNVPEGTRVATIQTRASDARVFETRRACFASKARLTRALAMHPATGRYAVLPVQADPPTTDPAAAEAIPVLTSAGAALRPVPHELFLASEPLFGRATPVDVSVTMHYTGARFSLSLRWSRWDKAAKDWVPLAPTVLDPDGGPVTFTFRDLAGVAKVPVNGVEDFWLRATLIGAPAADAPVVTSIRGVIAPAAIPEVPLDAAFFNATQLDGTRPFAPFGPRPVYGDALLLGSHAGFAPDNERFTLRFGIRPYRNAELAAQFTGLRAPMTIRTLARWEYLDRDARWRLVGQYEHEFRFSVGADPTYVVAVTRAVTPAGAPAGEGTFIGSTDGAGTVQVEVPAGLADIGVHTRHGVTSRWVRVLLLSEHPYGHEGVVTGAGATTRFVGPLLIPPRIESATVSYLPPVSDAAIPRVLSLNAFAWRDHSGAAVLTPFVPVAAREARGVPVFGEAPALLLAFDRPFEPSAFISLFVDLADPASSFTSQLESGRPRVVWEYWNGAWQALDAADDTLHLTTSGTVAFLAPADAASLVLAEQLALAEAPDPVARWWIRARLAEGRYDFPPAIRGVHPNTVMAEHRSTQAELLVGSSNGEPSQQFPLVKAPVLGGDLWVREPDRPTEPELRALRDEAEEDGADATRAPTSLLDVRTAPGGESEVWVHWHRVPNFELSGPRSRHYVLDAVSGRLAFGGGPDRRGLVPPPGRNNLVLREFVTGGGADRNTATLAIRELKSSLPFIDAVFNPQPAAGGSSAWSVAQLLTLGPQALKTRGRAVTTEDYESMVLQRFSEVARARCVPVTAPGPAGSLVFKAGGVTMLIVPGSAEARPQPSAGLSRRVREFLVASALRNIAGDVHVKGPDYVAVDIDARLVVRRPELAGLVERRAREALERFLHPLSGGEDRRGYGFGRPVHLSEVQAVLARVEDVEHVVHARFRDRPDASAFDVEGARLPSSGAHRIVVEGA